MSSPARTTARREIALLDGEGLARIEDEWAELWGRCRASPFQHPAWTLPWARRYAPGRFAAAALRIGGRLQGLAPVFAWKGALMLAGTGPSDRGDWLLAPGAESAADDLLAALAEWWVGTHPTDRLLADRCVGTHPANGCRVGETHRLPPGPFDRIELRQIAPGSALLAAAAPPGWTDEVSEDEPCHVAPLVGEHGLGAATKKCRDTWRYAMRRIVREGGVVELTPDAEVVAAMQDLSRLHALRWRERGESGVLADPLLDGFLRDAAPALARAGLLRLWRLRLGDETVAVLLALEGHHAHAYYLSGFDPAHARLSPSAALIGAAMAEAAREGAADFDFLRGAEPYKTRWGAEPRPTRRRVLKRP